MQYINNFLITPATYYKITMDLADRVAKLCLDKYASLKNTGKPNEKEWTVLSGVVLENNTKELSIISICTGTKCLSGVKLKSTKYEDRGSRLSDSHAEILARRALLRYLYYQIELLLRSNASDVFYLDENQIKLKDVSFHFFSSQTPCGDCSIIPKLKEELDDFSSPPKKKRKDEANDFESKFGVEITDVYRTGAKCVQTDIRQDLHEKGVNYHTVGLLRTKPGRGDRTLSLSCSDKIAKWNIMGVQGALLSLMIPTIRFKTIVIGGNCPYSLESMQRGIWKRFDLNMEAPDIVQSNFSFDQRKQGLRIWPCPSSIVWCAVPEKSIEVAVDGFRQGATKKKKKSCRLLISRKELFKRFLEVYDAFTKNKKLPRHPKKFTYYIFKRYSLTYAKLWEDTLKIIPTWPVKPSYLQECLNF